MECPATIPACAFKTTIQAWVVRDRRARADEDGIVCGAQEVRHGFGLRAGQRRLRARGDGQG